MTKITHVYTNFVPKRHKDSLTVGKRYLYEPEEGSPISGHITNDGGGKILIIPTHCAFLDEGNWEIECVEEDKPQMTIEEAREILTKNYIWDRLGSVDNDTITIDRVVYTKEELQAILTLWEGL